MRSPTSSQTRTPAPDDHLRRQHRLLRQRQARNQSLLDALEEEMETGNMGISPTPAEQFENFGTDKFGDYAAEAKQHWGDTDEWKKSQRRAAAYTKDDRIAIKGETATSASSPTPPQAGGPATGTVPMDLGEAHRQHISRRFYECSYPMHRGRAER